MLEPPAISDAAILACLRSQYGLRPVSLAFLPLGADLGTAVYRAATVAEDPYFVKLRFGHFDETAALLPYWLASQGISEVMAPLPSRSGRPWAETAEFTLLLYRFVDGRDAYSVVLSDEQWVAFGEATRRTHDAIPPSELADRLVIEEYSPIWRNRLRDCVARLDRVLRADPVVERFAAFLGERGSQVRALVDRTEELASGLQADRLPEVLCHTDLHPGNLLVSEDGRLHIVDWDAPLRAPRERDLMYPGGGQGFVGRSPESEEALFYEGYGAVQVDLRALAYYRLERIVEDLAIFCRQLLGPRESASGDSDADQEQALAWAMANFHPGGVLEIALETARRVSG